MRFLVVLGLVFSLTGGAAPSRSCVWELWALGTASLGVGALAVFATFNGYHDSLSSDLERKIEQLEKAAKADVLHSVNSMQMPMRKTAERILSDLAEKGQIQEVIRLIRRQAEETKATDVAYDQRPNEASFLALAEVALESSLGPYFTDKQKLDHIGFNIVWDPSRLPAGKEDPFEIVIDFQRRLFLTRTGDHFPEYHSDPVDFEDVLSGKFSSECRHRALLIYSVFKHYGRPAKIRLGNLLGKRHVWVELGGLVYDAANTNIPLPKAHFYSLLDSYYDDEGKEVLLEAKKEISK